MISVLLVDDKPSFLEKAKRLLEAEGDITVTGAGSARAALQLLREEKFDAVVSEYRLPRGDASGLIRALRERGDDTPVIVYASDASGDVAIGAMRGGAELFLRRSSNLEAQMCELECVIEEIGKRRRAEKTLERRERDFRAIVENNADAIVVIDRKGVIGYANPAALALFSLPQSEMIGRLLGSPLVRQEPVDMAVIREFKEVAAAEMRVAEVEWEGKPSYLISFRDISRHVELEEELRRARDELETRVKERTAELTKANANLKEEIETRSTIEEELRVEIEERTTAEEELRAEIEQKEQIEKNLDEARRMAELYLDLMAHDIRNLNQISLGYLELAQESTDVDEIRSLIAKPLEALNGASRIIDNVKKLKDITTDEAAYQALKAVNLCELLAGLKEQYTNIVYRDVTIDLETPPICFARANDLLADVFANLIENSIKHSDPEKPLTIDIAVTPITDSNKKYYLCSVEDNGPGIADYLKDKVFKRFQRGNTQAHGRGLGLYLVKRLIENYHGSLWLEDRVAGDYTKGIRFVIMLQAAA